MLRGFFRDISIRAVFFKFLRWLRWSRQQWNRLRLKVLIWYFYFVSPGHNIIQLSRFSFSRVSSYRRDGSPFLQSTL